MPAISQSTECCNACQKPWNEAHPLDWLNDLMICRATPAFVGLDRRICRINHTWREHVAESGNGKWFNTHFKVTRPAETE